MIPVRHQGGAADLPAHLDPDKGRRLVSEETDHGCTSDGPEVLHRLRAEQAEQGLVASHQSGEQDRHHDKHAGQIFDPPVSIGKAPARLQPGEGEGHREGDGGRGVGKVVERVREEGHTP